MSLQDRRVYCARARSARYERIEGDPPPELGPQAEPTVALDAVRRVLAMAGFQREKLGSREWNPLSEIVRDGDRVLVKPNWVSHRSRSGAGLDCLVTHSSVLEALLLYLAKARPERVVIADAPIQSCDFSALREACGLESLESRFARSGMPLEIADLRRTVLLGESFGSVSLTDARPMESYVLFDLGPESELEPISKPETEFRVTRYHPDALRRTHRPGRHQYLIAREAVEADVVINLPKLKTHKKAGLTGALKNVVGINGHKDYLAHHRKGGSERGGDCYPGRSRIKALVEELLDRANSGGSRAARTTYGKLAAAFARVARALGQDDNYEGSWYGNDTVWRMTLDLQRILHYGDEEGRMRHEPQRRVLTLTDAIVGGEGEGPLAPRPVPLGMLTLATNAAAAEWAHALLMGLDPRRIPLVRGAFGPHAFPLVGFAGQQVEVIVDGEQFSQARVAEELASRFEPPSGWTGHCEWRPPAACSRTQDGRDRPRGDSTP